MPYNDEHGFAHAVRRTCQTTKLYERVWGGWPARPLNTKLSYRVGCSGGRLCPDEFVLDAGEAVVVMLETKTEAQSDADDEKKPAMVLQSSSQ